MKIHQHNAGHMTKMAGMLIYGKNILEITGPILMKLCMKHERPKPFIVCPNYDPGLTLTCFMTRSNFATWAFIWENVTMMDSSEIYASSDLEFG